jgi:hypothetical protein
VFDTEAVTRALGITPTRVAHKAAPTPVSTCWEYRIDAGDEILLDAYLTRLIDTFLPKVAVINDLKQQLGLCTVLMFVIDIDIDPEASTPSFPLDRRAIRFLAATETEVDFDLYKVDPRV